jgi:tRNA (cmo5U34)-methyltransferase
VSRDRPDENCDHRSGITTTLRIALLGCGALLAATELLRDDLRSLAVMPVEHAAYDRPVFLKARAIGVLPYLVLREQLARAGRERVPEPMVMDEPESVAQFDWAGTSVLKPVYDACAWTMSRLLPPGGVVFDLGSGSGRFAAYLARRRPDIRILGIELSERMLMRSEATLSEERVADRVSLMQADMTDFVELMPARMDLVSVVLALHHLPSEEHLARCLVQLSAARDRAGCGVFIFDLARFKDPHTQKRLMRLEPKLPPHLWRDAVASERAAWTLEEVTHAGDQAGLPDMHHCLLHPLHGWQAHWTNAQQEHATGHAEWLRRIDIALLRATFRDLP